MKIKMPIKFFGNYQVTVRSGSSESRERCQKLTVVELQSKEKENPSEDAGTAESYRIIFHDSGCRRIIVGQLKENLEEKVVFQVDNKEYEFSPI
jgi:hypothetical protein